VKGKITKITEYKSGKGAFIGIDNQKPDYMFFGTIDVMVGNMVVFEEGKPTEKGNPTIKTIRLDAIEAYIDEDKPRSAPVLRAHDAPKADARETYWINKEKHDLVKDAVITRLSCISSAVNLHAQDSGTPIETVIKDAKTLEKYAKDGV